MSVTIADPILIMALPRSGSSMTAGLFAQHGVWTGTCRSGTGRNPKGFFESNAIRQIMREQHSRIVHRGVLATPRPGFRARVESRIVEEGYAGGPWLWKGSALFWPAWHEFQPRFVVCRRDPEATFKSCRAAPAVFGAGLADDVLRANIALHHAQLDFLVRERSAIEVDTRAVAHGDFASLKSAFGHCGLGFDEKIAADFVDPALWHYDA